MKKTEMCRKGKAEKGKERKDKPHTKEYKENAR